MERVRNALNLMGRDVQEAWGNRDARHTVLIILRLRFIMLSSQTGPARKVILR